MRKRGNSRAYLLRRLRKEHRDFAAALDRGEFKSVRAAAIAAGIVKEPCRFDRLGKAWAKASEEEKIQFLSQISESGILELGFHIQPITKQVLRHLSPDDQLRVILADERRALASTAFSNGDAKR